MPLRKRQDGKRIRCRFPELRASEPGRRCRRPCGTAVARRHTARGPRLPAGIPAPGRGVRREPRKRNCTAAASPPAAGRGVIQENGLNELTRPVFGCELTSPPEGERACLALPEVVARQANIPSGSTNVPVTMCQSHGNAFWGPRLESREKRAWSQATPKRPNPVSRASDLGQPGRSALSAARAQHRQGGIK